MSIIFLTLDLQKKRMPFNLRPMTFTNLSRLLTFMVFTITVSYCHAQCENDSIAPYGNIINISTVILGSESYEAEIYAIDFFFPTTTDNCSPTDSIRYTFTDMPPENDPSFIEEYNSSSLILTCVDENNSPISLTVYAWDIAGNYLSGTVSSTIVAANGTNCPECENDTIAPIITLLSELTAVFDQDSTSIEIWASDFVATAFDQCSPNDSILYSFSDTPPNGDPNYGVKFFDCYDLANSPISIEVYVWDTNGNYAVGTSLFNLQDNSGSGCEGNFEIISGSVLLKQNSPFEGAAINLENEQGDIIYTTYTDSEGDYTIFADPTAQYLSIAYYDESEPEITVLDLVFMQRNLLGLYPFEDYQKLASDIDGDIRIKVNDLKLIRQMLLGIIDKDEYLDPNWRFAIKNPSDSKALAKYSSRILISENPNPNFIGYRMGDVR